MTLRPVMLMQDDLQIDGGLKRVRVNGYRASALSSGTLPHTHEQKPIPQLEALPLTYEAFLPFGQVAQAYSTPTAAPRGVVKTTANQGTAAKYHKMAVLEDNYAVDGSENHRSLISVMTTQPKMQSGSSWDITATERSAWYRYLKARRP
jgi:allantoicase